MEKVKLIIPPFSDQDAAMKALAVGSLPPVIFKQYLREALLALLSSPKKIVREPEKGFPENIVKKEFGSFGSPCAEECRGACCLIEVLKKIERKVTLEIPEFSQPQGLLDWYIQNQLQKMDLECSQAFHFLEGFHDDQVVTKGYQYLFGDGGELNPAQNSLRERIRSFQNKLDGELARLLKENWNGYVKGSGSILGYLKSKLGGEVANINCGLSHGRIWILLFDGMRYDAWEAVVQPILAEHFSIEAKPCFCMLPSFTGIARNSFFAGCPPEEWQGFKGSPSSEEVILLARNLGLTHADMKEKIRWVSEADTVKARKLMGFSDSDAKEINVLIYPIADDCHEFRGDLFSFYNKIRTEMLGSKIDGIRGILDDLLKRLKPDDTVIVASDHGFIELFYNDWIPFDNSSENSSLEDGKNVHFRFIQGKPSLPEISVFHIPSGKESFCVPVGGHWFRREGTKNFPRYEHGGLSLAEVVVPAAILKRVTEKEAKVEMMDLPLGHIQIEEDKAIEIAFEVENSGNLPSEFDLLVKSNLGEVLASHRGKLAPSERFAVKFSITGRFKLSSNMEPDPMNTTLSITCRLRHTDQNNNWRDAMDGLRILPVLVKAKKTKLDTDALKGFDDL